MTPFRETPINLLRVTLLFPLSHLISCYAVDLGPYEMDPVHQSPISVVNALVSGKALLENAITGEGEGEYPLEKIDQLKAVLYATEQLESPAPLDIHQLYDALSIFESSVHSNYGNLIDTRATKETRYLYEILKSTAADTLYYGMHDTLGYGVGWRANNRRSDVSDVVGDLPAIFGWDAFEITHHKTGDSLRDRIEYSYRLGGIQAMCWHAYDPLDKSFYHDGVSKSEYGSSVVDDILPGGKHHATFKNRLDQLATFFKSLRGPKGESIPLLFRPWHEHNGSWFWWGKPQTDPEDYLALWRFTVEYLRDEKNVHNLIYVFSPDAGQYSSPEDYFEIYPGDNYADVFGVDAYWMGIPALDKEYFINKIRSLAQVAHQRGKLAAVTETGDKFAAKMGGERLANAQWFSHCLEAILTDEDTRRIAFVMTWRNDRPKHHFNPYLGHPSVPDFKRFHQHPYTTFLKKAPKLYQEPTIKP